MAMRSSGSYERLTSGEKPGVRSQVRFMELARERSRENDGLRGLTGTTVSVAPAPRTLDKLRRRPAKKRKRRHRDE